MLDNRQEKLEKILALIDSGLTAGKACKKEKVKPATFYLWKNKFGGGQKNKKFNKEEQGDEHARIVTKLVKLTRKYIKNASKLIEMGEL
jgi:hypothetical protein